LIAEAKGGVMRRIVCWMIALGLVIVASIGKVLGDNPPLPPGARQADVHNPFSPRYLDFRPGGLARRSFGGVTTQGHHPGHFGGGGFGFYPGYYPSGHGGYFYNYPSYYSPYYSQPFYQRPYVYAPQTTIVNNTTIVSPPARDVAAPNVAKRVPGIVNRDGLRATNAHSRELSRRFLGFGDRQFAQGKYADAQLRYRKAMKVAPDLAESYFRRGQAMIALGRYDAAAAAIKQGLKLKPAWAMGQYRLAVLYGGDKQAMQRHLAALLHEAGRQPLLADLEFLTAWQMFFGGQRDKAGAHFRRAADLADDPGYLEAFLAATKPNEPELPQEKKPGDKDAPDAEDAPDPRLPDVEVRGVEI